MAKLKNTKIGVRDLKEYLSGQDDFRLEIAAFKHFKKRGLDVLHGGTYEDPVTKVARQFDIRGTVRKNGCSVHLAVECKSLKDFYPLLVSTIPRTKEESYHEIVYSHKRTGNYSVEPMGSNFDSVRIDNAFSVYEPQKSCGKSTTQVGRGQNGELITGDGEVYGKWSQAVSSAYDLVSDSTDDYEKNEHGAALSIIIPVLVLNDGVLWQADYDQKGELLGDPRQVDFCEYYLGKSIWTGPMGVGYVFSHLHIFTLAKFEGFLDRLMMNDHYWNALFPIEEIQRKIAEKLKEE